MRNSEVTRQLQQLRSLIDRTRYATQDINLQGHWSRYLCIMTAGFLENSLRSIYSEFARSSSSPHVARYVDTRLRLIYNPNAQRFINTASNFDRVWGDQLQEFLAKDSSVRKNAIDSIIGNRNQIAHGGVSQISIARVQEYLEHCVEVLEFIEDQCLGPST